VKYRYTKYNGDLLDQIDLEDLVSKLSDLLLSSGFSNPWGDPSNGDEDRTMQALHDAILEALFSGGVLSEEALQELLGEPADGDQEKTLIRLIRIERDDWLPDAAAAGRAPAAIGRRLYRHRGRGL
jgi:hypothetical protein